MGSTYEKTCCSLYLLHAKVATLDCFVVRRTCFRQPVVSVENILCIVMRACGWVPNGPNNIKRYQQRNSLLLGVCDWFWRCDAEMLICDIHITSCICIIF